MVRACRFGVVASPVGYLPDGDRFLVCGSNGGSEHPPAWSLNPRTHPDATVEDSVRWQHGIGDEFPDNGDGGHGRLLGAHGRIQALGGWCFSLEALRESQVCRSDRPHLIPRPLLGWLRPSQRSEVCLIRPRLRDRAVLHQPPSEASPLTAKARAGLVVRVRFMLS